MSDGSSEAIAKFTGHKVSSVKWRPVQRGSLTPSSTFVSGSWDQRDNVVCVWSTAQRNGSIGDDDDLLPSQQPELVNCTRHEGDVTDIQYFDEERFLVASSQGSVSLMTHSQQDQRNVQCVHRWEGLHRHPSQAACPCTSIAVGMDTVATVGEDGTINALRINRSQPIWTAENADSCSLNAVLVLRVSELLTINSGRHLKVWDMRSSDKKHSKLMLLSGESGSLNCAAKHPTQSHVVACGDSNGVLSVWDMRQERYPVTLMEAHKDGVWDICFHPLKPNHIFTCSQDGSAFHWDGSASQRSVQLAVGAGGVPSLLAAAGGAGLKVGGGDSLTESNPWLSGDLVRSRVSVASLLPRNPLPVNSLDVDALSNSVVLGTDSQSVCLVSGLAVQ